MSKFFEKLWERCFALFPYVGNNLTIREERMIAELQRALRADSELFQVYQAIIAMAFMDARANYLKATEKTYLNHNDIHIIANAAAENFLNLLIKDVD